MKTSKIISGLRNIITIWLIVSVDVVLLLEWADVSFLSIFIPQKNTFFDSVIHVILTIFFSICTYILVNDYGKD